MIDVVGSRCCGCTACKDVCPQGCIAMLPNEEGFLYPSVDRSKCVGCDLCEKVCPVLSRKSKEDAFYKNVRETYAAVSKDRKTLSESSSGGVFTSLAKNTLREGGHVFGAAFSDDFRTVQHVVIDRIENLNDLRGSKYLQSELGNSFSQCKEYLSKGDKVLFTGIPCQIAGLKRFLGREDENLTCVEVICHGTPSVKVWKKYLDHVEAKQGKTKEASFRDKTVGWNNFGMKISSVTGQELKEIHQGNTYMAVFLRNFALRESCYECPAKGENTCADITLGDFWGIQNAYPEYYDDQGVSVVVVHTEKGKKALEEVAEDLVLHETDPFKSLEDNWIIYKPVERPAERDTFYQDLDRRSWKWIVNKYLDQRSVVERGIDLLRRVKRAVVG